MATIKQYVNLDPDRAAELDGLDKARAGKDVVFEATVDPVATGIAVVFEITRGANNVTEAGTVSKVVKTTGDDGKAKLPFVLTPHGGDEFTVKASLSVEEGAGDQLGEDTYVVWRRVYYQLSRFRAGVPGAGQPLDSLPEIPAFDVGALTAELAARRHNIELVDKTQAALIDRNASVLTRDNGSRDLKTALLDGYDPALVPVTLRLLIASQIAEVKTASSIQYGVGQTSREEIYLDARALLDDPSYAKDADWFVSATWDMGDGPQPLAAIYLEKTAEGEVYVDFRNAVPWDRETVDESLEVDVKLTYRYASGFCNGTSMRNSVCLASKDRRGQQRSAADMTDTAMHEIGHFLHLVPAEQATHYVQRGHNGPHCHTGVREGLLGGQQPFSGEDGTCIMFGESTPTRASQFCASCDPSVRKSAVQRVGMPDDPAIDWP